MVKLPKSPSKRSKYGAIKTEVDGITFASKREAKRYCELKLMEQAGEICNLECQPWFNIAINGQYICKVILDFQYEKVLAQAPNEIIIEDVKGKDTTISRLKRKLVEAQHGIKVRLI